jgi:hypothetical protein
MVPMDRPNKQVEAPIDIKLNKQVEVTWPHPKALGRPEAPGCPEAPIDNKQGEAHPKALGRPEAPINNKQGEVTWPHPKALGRPEAPGCPEAPIDNKQGEVTWPHPKALGCPEAHLQMVQSFQEFLGQKCHAQLNAQTSVTSVGIAHGQVWC